MARERIEYVTTLLKVNLQLSSTCHVAKQALLHSLGDNALFAQELSKYFAGGQEAIPYHITPSDPSQVAVLKKIINALDLAEKGFKSLEDINVSSDRSTFRITLEVIPTAYKVVHELYAAVQLLNTSSTDVQAMIGPHISGLLPKLGVVSEVLTQFTPETLREPGTALAEDPASFSAKAVAAVVARLPTEVQTGSAGIANVSSLIFSLPQYFEALQAQIDTGVSQIILKPTTTAESYQAAIQARANKTKAQFEKLASSSNSMLKMPSYISAVKELAAHGSDLMSTGAPLTKLAYEEAVAKLNLIRHQILPALVVELEILEESMSLKPGTLVDPAVEQMEIYYKQFASYVDGIAQAAGVLDNVAVKANSRYGDIVRILTGGARPDVGDKLAPVANLDVLRDEIFEEYTNKQRTTRLVQAQLQSQDESKALAAEEFFNRIQGLTWWTHKQSLANATPAVKTELLALYKQFQEYFAAHSHQIDRSIVEALSARNEGGMFSRVINTHYGQLITSQFKEIMECKDAVMESIAQASAQSAFEARVIEEGAHYHAKNFYAARNNETELKIDTRAFNALPFAVEEGLSVADCKKRQLAAALQLHNLKKAKGALEQFSVRLLSRHPEDKMNALSIEDKEALRIAYKQFQPHVVVSEGDFAAVASLDERIVEALDSKLQVAHATLMEFSAHLIRQYPDGRTRVSALPPEEKEILRNAYKKFQFYVDSTDNAVITDALTSNNEANDLRMGSFSQKLGPSFEGYLIQLIDQQQHRSDLQVHELINSASAEDVEEREDSSLQTTLQTKLNELIRSSRQQLDLYTRQAATAKQAELNAAPIEAMGSTFEKKTLFGQLQSLNFSSIVGAFIEQQDPDAQLPYTEFHKDGPDIQMRKKLINALYHLQGSLAKLEALDGQDPKNVLTRGWYMTSLLYVVFDVVAIRTSLIEASGNPGLSALIQEGYKMLEPLQGLPFIGEYLQNSMAPIQAEAGAMDIVALWEAEQSIVRLMRAGENPLEAAVAATLPAVQEVTTAAVAPHSDEQDEVDADVSVIRTIADQLFNIPQQLRGLHSGEFEPDQGESQVRKEALIASLSGLSYGPGSLAKVLQAVQTLNIQLTEVGTESRKLAFRTIADLPASVGATLVSIADTAEFHLGLDKPGDLSSGLTARFNTFYSSLIENLPFKQDQDGLNLILNSTALMDARIKNEEERRAELVATQDRVEREARDFIATKLAVFETAYRNGFTKHQEKIAFLREYAEFQPYLVKIDNNYNNSSFLRTLQKTGHFTVACQNIIKLRRKLEELVASGIVETRIKEIQRCDLRIEHLKAQRVKEKLEGEKRIKLFKESVSTHYLNESVRSQYQSQLGPYTAPFVATIEKSFAAERDDVLAPIHIEDNIEEAVAARIDGEIISHHFELLGAYSELNTALNTINTWIRLEENMAEGNPCRTEKLEKLREEQQRLTQTDSFSTDTSVADIRIHCLRAQALINGMKEYNAMIKLYAKLQDMRDYLSSLPDNDTNNVDKLAEITTLQGMLLAETRNTPNQRFETVYTRGMSESCKQILLHSADHPFIKLLKVFWSYLTGWKSQGEQKYALFKSELEHVREEVVPATTYHAAADDIEDIQPQ